MTSSLSEKIPRFAVIGRVNEGKSSIVATLTENDRVAIGPDPGTTEKATLYEILGDGHLLLQLIDTPGFEEPERALAWLRGRAETAAQRQQAIKDFVETFRDTGTFTAEVELLTPILEGASVIYVVSSQHPFRPGFEAEMEILRWTGAPRLALINKGGGHDFGADWKTALRQYFNIVKEFDAMSSGFYDRMNLLDALRVMDDGFSQPLDRAMKVLSDIQERRLQRAVELASHLLQDMLTFRMVVSEEDAEHPNKHEVMERFYSRLRSIEASGRVEMEQLFSFSRLQREEDDFAKPIYDKDLFAAETWQFLGQPRWVLVALGGVAGGAMGGAVDVKSAGATGFLGAPIGALLGAMSVVGATVGQPEAKIKGAKLGGRVMTIGPHMDANFPWVLLDRILLHMQALLARTHAVRDQLRVGRGESEGLVHGFRSARTLSLGKLFAKIRRAESPRRYHSALVEALTPIVFDLASAQKARGRRV